MDDENSDNIYDEGLKKIIESILEKRDEAGCWNVLSEGDKYFPDFNYYVPNYKSTLWTLILLAEIKANPKDERFIKPLKVITEHFFDRKIGIFHVGKSHFPIPCLNGNMIYLHSYFNSGQEDIINAVIDFFIEHQRFDDGDFVTPSSFPYFSNKSCYGKHTCYFGVIKLLKGLSFIPREKRSENAKALINKCIDFILLHDVCYSSHNKSEFIQSYMSKLTFPNMYKGDCLEVLWILKRENVKSEHLNRALDLLKSKRSEELTWELERQVKDLIVPITKRKLGNKLITERAAEVLDYYDE